VKDVAVAAIDNATAVVVALNFCIDMTPLVTG